MRLPVSFTALALFVQGIGISDATSYNSDKKALFGGRRLAYDKLWVYEPRSLVTDHVSEHIMLSL